MAPCRLGRDAVQGIGWQMQQSMCSMGYLLAESPQIVPRLAQTTVAAHNYAASLPYRAAILGAGMQAFRPPLAQFVTVSHRPGDNQKTMEQSNHDLATCWPSRRV